MSMIEETKSAPKRHRRRSTKKPKRTVYFVLPIEEWDWGYSFGINDWKLRPDEAYLDHRHLRIVGSLDRPSAMQGRRTKVSFVPDDLPQDIHRYRSKPERVGTMWLNRKEMTMEGVLSMPIDALPNLIPMLLAGRLKYLVIDGFDFYRGNASVRNYRFSATLDPDDLPPE